MTPNESKLELTGTWARAMPATDRWQSLQASISRQAAPAFGWARRSSMTCRWRAVPASVSALSRI